MRPATPRSPTSTQPSWTAWRASSKPRVSSFPGPVTVKDGTSKVGFLAYGTTDFALRESLDQIKKEHGLRRGLHAHPGLSLRP